MDDNDKKNLKSIIFAFGQSGSIDVEKLIENKIVDCDHQRLKKLIGFMKYNGYITCSKSVEEWEVSLPLVIWETEKLRKERTLLEK